MALRGATGFPQGLILYLIVAEAGLAGGTVGHAAERLCEPGYHASTELSSTVLTSLAVTVITHCSACKLDRQARHTWGGAACGAPAYVVWQPMLPDNRSQQEEYVICQPHALCLHLTAAL